MCSLAYHLITSQFQASGEEGADTLEQIIEGFESQIGMRYDTQDAALKAVRAHMTAMGLDPDEEERKAAELAGGKTEGPQLQWWEDTDIEYKPQKG